jgi:membrane-bound lytic murein transglycosylase A
MKLSLLCAVSFSLFVFSCARAPLTDPAKSFLPARNLPELRDTHSLESLREALKKTLQAYKTSTTIPQEFRFADRMISRTDMRDALEALEPEMASLERFHAFMINNFDFYEVYGDEEPGQIFSTGYYDVAMKGSRKPIGKLTEPLYKLPPDMVTIDLNAFAERMPDVKPLQSLLVEMKSKKPSWRGRIIPGGAIPTVVPYWQRSDIQRQRPLAGKGLELVYVDPIDAFFVEIQGSGVVELPDGSKLRIGYDGQNGGKYEPIGKYLWHVIPKELMSMQRIRRHLETLDREKQQDIFDRNPSYVFFKELKGESLTYSGSEVTAHRTIASDSFLFPKGTLAFLEIETPIFSDSSTERGIEPDSLDPSGWEFRPRWVFDQDTGGAIRGGGRTDIYMGLGPEAGRLAGPMKRKGKLWYVAPKLDFTERLRARTGLASK